MTSPLDLNAESFLPLFWTLCAASLGAAWFLRRSLSPPPQHSLGGNGGELSEFEAACLAGGKKRALHAAVASLVAQGDLRNEGEVLVRVDPAAPPGGTGDRPALERAVLRAVGSGRADLGSVETAVAPELDDLHASLRARGLVHADYASASGCWLAGLPVLLVLGLGIAKIITGLGRGKPVGYLLGSCILLAIWASGILTNKRRWLTPAGKAKLAELRAQHAGLSKPDLSLPAGATGGPLLGGRTIPLAVGLFGGAVLAGTAWAALHDDFQRREKYVGSGDGGGSYSGGSDGGSSDGGGGDGGGGGGCGGCGGGGGD